MKPAGRLRSLGRVLLAAVAIACGGDESTPVATPSPSTDRLSVHLTPRHDSIPVGSSLIYRIEVHDGSRVVPSPATSWSSTNTDVVTVDGFGLATSVGEGAAQIIATAFGIPDTANVEVVGHGTALRIVPDAASMFIADEIQVSVEATVPAGTSNPPITWTSSDTMIATVSGEGVVTALGTGEAQITGTLGTATARMRVAVSAPEIASLSIAPATSSVAIGDDTVLAVAAISPAGRVLPTGFPVRWETSDSSIASVDESGRVRALARGYATLRASVGETSATATVNVTHAPASVIAVTLRDTAFLVGESAAIVASVADRAGRVIQSPVVAWSSSDTRVAKVDLAGQVSAIAAGKATISATSGSAVATANLTVERRAPSSIQLVPAAPTVLVGDTAQLFGRVVDQHGKPLGGYPVSWTASNSAIAAVTPNGLLTGTGAGVASLAAASGSLKAQFRVIVASQPIGELQISPPVATVDQGDSVTLVTSLRDAEGHPLGQRVAAWESSNAFVATVDANGTATGHKPGTAIISAAIEGKAATARVVVRAASPATVASIDLTANSPSLAKGQSTQIVATLHDENGATLSGLPIAWASLDSSIARVSRTGMVTAVAPGSVSITASSGEASSSLAVVVDATLTATVATVKVALASTLIDSGKTTQAAVTLKDALGTILTGRTVTYTTTRSTVATVSPTGLVTGVATGEAGIRATVDGVSGTAWIRVKTGTAAVSKVVVRAPATTMTVGTTLQAGASLYDAAGNTLSGTVTWSSSNAAVAKVGTNGLVTAISAGGVTIRAAAGGVTGALGLTVTTASTVPVASVSVSLGTASLLAGQTASATAIARDAAGQILTGRTFLFTSSNTAVATVSTTGMVTALKTGTASISATSGGKVGAAALTVATASTTPPTSAAAALAKFGPTRSLSAAQALGGGYARYDGLWTTWEPTRWSVDGAHWSGNYYDRAQIYYAQWIRTGNAVYKTRGDAMALNYRRNYLATNNYQTSAHWSQLDGVALHYWLTGDDSSRIAVGRAARSLAGTALWPRNGQWTDARQQARALIAILVAWQLNAPYAPTGGWAKALDDGLTAILPQQSADGGWRYPVNTCNLSLNYMGAMLADALIRVYTQYRPDPRIPGAVKKTADFLWTQWRSKDAIPSFNYYEGVCVNHHGAAAPTATADLTGMFTSTYAWMSSQDPAYRAKSDLVFSATMKGMFPQGSKQFNQAFAFGWRALGYVK